MTFSTGVSFDLFDPVPNNRTDAIEAKIRNVRFTVTKTGNQEEMGEVSVLEFGRIKNTVATETTPTSASSKQVDMDGRGGAARPRRRSRLSPHRRRNDEGYISATADVQGDRDQLVSLSPNELNGQVGRRFP